MGKLRLRGVTCPRHLVSCWQTQDSIFLVCSSQHKDVVTEIKSGSINLSFEQFSQTGPCFFLKRPSVIPILTIFMQYLPYVGTVLRTYILLGDGIPIFHLGKKVQRDNLSPSGILTGTLLQACSLPPNLQMKWQGKENMVVCSETTIVT